MNIIDISSKQLMNLLPESVLIDVKNNFKKQEMITNLSNSLKYNKRSIANSDLIKHFASNGISDTTEMAEVLINNLYSAVHSTKN